MKILDRIGEFFVRFVYNTFWMRFINHYQDILLNKKLGSRGHRVYFSSPKSCLCPQKIFLFDDTNILPGATFIINPKCKNGRFIMKKKSGSAENLTVITGNHQRKVGFWFKDCSGNHIEDIDKDIVVHEDVWIGAGVTLCSGSEIGRGATIGAATVVRSKVPPYAIVIGNPAKVVGFSFTPEEIIEHEMLLYPEEERLPLDLLEKNYKKYFLDHIKEIKAYTSLICK